jgi:hypothetical protein
LLTYSRQLHLQCGQVMSFESGEYKPLLHYSENEERAHFFDLENIDMPRRKTAGKKRRSRKVVKRAKGVRLVKGRLALRLRGIKGVQHIAPSHLVKYIALGKLKAAARKLWQQTHSGKKVKRSSRKRRSRRQK